MKAQLIRPACSVAVLTMLGLLPGIASANDGVYVGIEGGYNYENPQNLFSAGPATITNKKFDAGYVVGANVGYAFASGFRPEFAFDYRRNDVRKLLGVPNTGAVIGYDTAYTAFANLWYDLKQPTGLFSVVHPYIGGGVGALRLGTFGFDGFGVPRISDRGVALGYQGGAGIGFDLTKNLSASIDYRYVESNAVTLADENNSPARERYRANSGLIGLRYTFGGPKPVEVAAAAPAPAPLPVVAPPPPPPAPVDSDGDGVTDDLDKCPGTPKGFKVDANGCIIEQTLVLRAVNFEYNLSRLTGPSQETLDEVAKALVGQPELNVQIGGYTDSRGSAAYNLKLSELRANAVKTYLVGKGVKADSLKAKGFGKASPIASNATEEGRTENRRVEFVVLNKPAAVKVVNEASTKASKAAAAATAPKAAPKKK